MLTKKPCNQGFHYPFRSKVSKLLRAERHTQRFGLTVSFRRFSSSFYESYPMGGASTSTSLMNQLVQAVIPPQHDASAEISQPAVLSSTRILIFDRV